MINPNMDRRVPLCDPNEKEISPFIKTHSELTQYLSTAMSVRLIIFT